jgi:hypothetical protein
MRPSLLNPQFFLKTTELHGFGIILNKQVTTINSYRAAIL